MKPLKLLLPLSLVVLFATALPAQEACPCFPRENLWVVKTCADHNCAMTALNAANGDPLTFTMPVGTSDNRWVVLQRVVAGAYTDDGSDPYQVETFDGASLATARLGAIETDHRPMIVSAPDGMFLVLSLKRAPLPRQRSADH
jgi:hypothetical protein